MTTPYNAPAPPAQGYRRFTAADDGTLRRMAAEGCASSEIAATLGRQIETVVKRARAIGVVIGLRKPGRQRGPQRPVLAATCPRCGVFLSRAPAASGDVCGWCEGERHG